MKSDLLVQTVYGDSKVKTSFEKKSQFLSQKSIKLMLQIAMHAFPSRNLLPFIFHVFNITNLLKYRKGTMDTNVLVSFIITRAFL